MTTIQPVQYRVAYYFAFSSAISMLIGIAPTQILLGLAVVAEKKEAVIG